MLKTAQGPWWFSAIYHRQKLWYVVMICLEKQMLVAQQKRILFDLDVLIKLFEFLQNTQQFDPLYVTISRFNMWMCTEHKSKYEHDKSHSLMKAFLNNAKTKKHLSTGCISAIIKYSDSLMCKKKYLANHPHKNTTNCMDSATTSLVESQNQVVHGHLGVWSNLNIEMGMNAWPNTLMKKLLNPRTRVFVI